MITKPQHHSNKTAAPFRKISKKLRSKIEGEIKALLHEQRDCMRYAGQDTRDLRFTSGISYNKAHGILQCLAIQGYGSFSALCRSSNLSLWFHQLEDEVLKEEGFFGDGVCTYCKKKYGKDDSEG